MGLFLKGMVFRSTDILTPLLEYSAFLRKHLKKSFKIAKIFSKMYDKNAYKEHIISLFLFIAFIRKHYIPEGVKITVLRSTQPFKNNSFMENNMVKIVECRKLESLKFES